MRAFIFALSARQPLHVQQKRDYNGHYGHLFTKNKQTTTTAMMTTTTNTAQRNRTLEQEERLRDR